MRITVLLDPEVNLSSLEHHSGHLIEWFDSYVVEALRALGNTVSLIKFRYDVQATIAQLIASEPDVVFNLMTSGGYGDGRDVTAVAVLEALNIRYTGTSPAGIILTNDKATSKRVLRDAGVPVPDFLVVRADQHIGRANLQFPLLVKPLAGGASMGLTLSALVTNKQALERRINFIHRTRWQPAICERFVAGRELTVGIVGNGKPKVLPPLEWHFPNQSRLAPTFFTSRAKWNDKYRKKHGIYSSRPDLSPSIARQVQIIALKAYSLLCLRDYASVDLRVALDGTVYFIEANSNPGLWPYSGRFGTIPFERLIQKIVSFAYRRR